MGFSQDVSPRVRGQLGDLLFRYGSSKLVMAEYNPLSGNQTEVSAAFEIMLLHSPYRIES